MNIAQRQIAYYESDSFKDNYKELLIENFGNDEGDIINRIIDKFNVSNYETEKELKNWFVISREQAQKIYSFIEDNIDEFITDFSGYYVGYTSLESVEFGEQEDQLTGIYNHKTGKNYSINYLRKVYSNEGFCINDSNPDYAYYIVSGGLHVDLLNNVELLDNFLAELKN